MPPQVASPQGLREALSVFLRHASPRILITALALALLARGLAGDFGPADLVPIALLLLLWPLQEWLIHVCVLHWRPRRLLGRTLDFAVPRSHRAHHADPTDLSLVFIPLHSYVYTLPLLLLFWLTVSPSVPLALTGLAAYLVLALHYEWVHFLVHTRWKPRWRPYRALWLHHRLHHYKNEHYWFGVTRRGADRWLRTLPVGDAVPTSPTCRTLHEADAAGPA
jgi:sterol desaturase/sphingolipid hydroxylase (fatty acid hydroxylase superfamily)